MLSSFTFVTAVFSLDLHDLLSKCAYFKLVLYARFCSTFQFNERYLCIYMTNDQFLNLVKRNYKTLFLALKTVFPPQ